MPTLKFFGHACFLLSHENTAILFDPFLTDNPYGKAKPEEISCNYILVSHAHFDHLGDAVAIAKRTGATVVSTAEVARLCGDQGCKAEAMHIGGKRKFDFGHIRITLAFHGAGVPGGHACGFAVNFFGKTVYHAGDTGLFGDMELIGRLESIDYALLPIGGNFTMGPEDAVEAVGLLKPRTVIPMHYGTWPVIEQSPEAFKAAVETRYSVPVRIVRPGEAIEL